MAAPRPAMTDRERERLHEAIKGLASTLQGNREKEQRKEFEYELARSLAVRFGAAWLGLELAKRINDKTSRRIRIGVFGGMTALFGLVTAAQFIKDE